MFILGVACSVVMFLTKEFYLGANNIANVSGFYQLGIGSILGGIITALATIFGGYALLITKK